MISITSVATWLLCICSARIEEAYARRGVGVACPAETTGTVSTACKQVPAHLDQPSAIGDHCIWRIAAQRRCRVLQSPAHPAPVGALVRGFSSSSTMPAAFTLHHTAAAMESTGTYWTLHMHVPDNLLLPSLAESLLAVCWPSLLQHDALSLGADPCSPVGGDLLAQLLEPAEHQSNGPAGVGAAHAGPIHQLAALLRPLRHGGYGAARS